MRQNQARALVTARTDILAAYKILCELVEDTSLSTPERIQLKAVRDSLYVLVTTLINPILSEVKQ